VTEDSEVHVMISWLNDSQKDIQTFNNRISIKLWKFRF